MHEERKVLVDRSGFQVSEERMLSLILSQ